MSHLIQGTHDNRRAAVIERLARAADEFGSVSNEDVREASRELDVTPRHIRRLIKLRLEGKPLDRGRFIVPEDAITHLFQFRGNVTMAYRQLDEEGVDLPSLRTFQHAIATQVPAPIIAAASDGPRGFRNATVYLKGLPTFRGHTYLLDATDTGVKVPIHPRSKETESVWLINVLDYQTRLIIGWSISVGRPNADDVKVALIAAIRSRHVDLDGKPVHLGGVPVRAQWDNGGEFTARTVTELCAAFGFHGYAVAPYSPHLKARVEVSFRGLKAELLALPGNTRGPKNFNGTPVFAAQDDQLLDSNTVRAAIDQAIADYNARRHGELGMSPLEAWAADPHPLTMIPDVELWSAMSVRARRKVGSFGVRLDYVDYISPELCDIRGTTVEVRYLQSDRSFIEVFLNDRHLCTAYPRESLSANEDAEILNHRRRLQGTARKHLARAKKPRTRSRTAVPNDQVEGESDEGNAQYLRHLEQRRLEASRHIANGSPEPLRLF